MNAVLNSAIGGRMCAPRCDMKCCTKALWYWQTFAETDERYQALVPLKDVLIEGTLNGVLSTVKVQLIYINAIED